MKQYDYKTISRTMLEMCIRDREYFLVDEGLYAARPDLLMTGRTLMGHDSAKNQQLEDHLSLIHI